MEPSQKKIRLDQSDSNVTDPDWRPDEQSSLTVLVNGKAKRNTSADCEQGDVGNRVVFGLGIEKTKTYGHTDTQETEPYPENDCLSIESGGFEVQNSTDFDNDLIGTEGCRVTLDNDYHSDADSMHSGGFVVLGLHHSPKHGKSSVSDDVTRPFPSTAAKPVLTRVDSQAAGPSCSKSSTALKKIASVAQDAESISAVLGLDCVDDSVYRRLKQLRSKGNRMDLVINELLESGIESMREKLNKIDEESSGSGGIFDDIDSVKSALDEKLVSQVKPDEIYELLEGCKDEKNRIETVVEQLVKRYRMSGSSLKESALGTGENRSISSEVDAKSDQKDNSDAIVDEVQQVLKALPQADPNNVFTLLESQANNSSRVQNVINILKSENSSSKHEPSADSATDDLYRDMSIVSSMLPGKDKNEIYAYLEAHYHKANRVQIVAEELLRMEQGSQEAEDTATLRPVSSDGHVSTINTRPTITELRRDVEMILKVFPDCDPNYIFEQLEAMGGTRDRVDRLSAQMFDLKNYPKLTDRVEVENRKQRLRQLQNMDLNIAEFLQVFPEPEEVFYDESTAVSGAYKEHALTQLENDVPMLSIAYIRKKLESHANHYLPALVELKRAAEFWERDRYGAARAHKRFLATPRPGTKKMPENPDEYFYKELLFARNENTIMDHIEQQKEAKAARVDEARRRGELYECTCCYEDEVLFEDMLACPEGHLFCRQCIRGQADSHIGQAILKFPCLEADCDVEFSMTTLQVVLSPKSFSILLRRIQEDEIRRADIPDLVGCPFCSFATVITDEADKVLKCLNPECLKESCRLCKEPNHIPLRCDEVEKDGEKNMRAYIEQKMTEAMIRTCHACKKRFYKIEGCNKMTCACGASMCYVCREPITGYEHFNGGQCSNVEDAATLHQDEMQKAAEEARAEYLRDHPEAAGTELKHDPLKLLEGRNDVVYGRYIDVDNDDMQDEEYEEYLEQDSDYSNEEFLDEESADF